MLRYWFTSSKPWPRRTPTTTGPSRHRGPWSEDSLCASSSFSAAGGCDANPDLLQQPTQHPWLLQLDPHFLWWHLIPSGDEDFQSSRRHESHFCTARFKIISFFLSTCQTPQTMGELYDNKYSLFNNIYFYETFSTQTSRACTLSYLFDTLSDFLDKSTCFSLFKIESVSINPSQATLGSQFPSVVNTFRLKMLHLVLIMHYQPFVCLIWILSNKLDLKPETHFPIFLSLIKS